MQHAPSTTRTGQSWWHTFWTIIITALLTATFTLVVARTDTTPTRDTTFSTGEASTVSETLSDGATTDNTSRTPSTYGTTTTATAAETTTGPSTADTTNPNTPTGTATTPTGTTTGSTRSRTDTTTTGTTPNTTTGTTTNTTTGTTTETTHETTTNTRPDNQTTSGSSMNKSSEGAVGGLGTSQIIDSGQYSNFDYEMSNKIPTSTSRKAHGVTHTSAEIETQPISSLTTATSNYSRSHTPLSKSPASPSSRTNTANHARPTSLIRLCDEVPRTPSWAPFSVPRQCGALYDDRRLEQSAASPCVLSASLASFAAMPKVIDKVGPTSLKQAFRYRKARAELAQLYRHRPCDEEVDKLLQAYQPPQISEDQAKRLQLFAATMALARTNAA